MQLHLIDNITQGKELVVGILACLRAGEHLLCDFKVLKVISHSGLLLLLGVIGSFGAGQPHFLWVDYDIDHREKFSQQLLRL